MYEGAAVAFMPQGPEGLWTGPAATENVHSEAAYDPRYTDISMRQELEVCSEITG